MEACPHNKIAPASVIAGLHESQAGAGRHACPVCAYVEGKKAGEAGVRVPGGRIQGCQVGHSAPLSVLTTLPIAKVGQEGTNALSVLTKQASARALPNGRARVQSKQSRLRMA